MEHTFMKYKQSLLSIAISAFLSTSAVSANPVHEKHSEELKGKIKHVLMVSVDGLHALDVANYISTNPESALAELSEHAITYSKAKTPANSDSFPGLLALVTGGSPNSHGLFYDVSYNRSTVYSDSSCTTPLLGNIQVYDESIDSYDKTDPHNWISKNTIDPTQLPYYRNEKNQCVHKYPHNSVLTNTVFEVIKENGGLTAWADKHPAYDILNGPSGGGVHDLYTPEITSVNGFDNTVSVVCTGQNDDLKVAAILNQIQGKSHDGRPDAGIPTFFGMNFQAVSVGQKLASNNTKSDHFDATCSSDQLAGPGGYIDGSGTPTPVLAYGLKHTDDSLKSMISALKTAGIYDSTLFIVTAKHGQSPINPDLVNKPGHFADLVATLPDAGSNLAAAAIADAANCPGPVCGSIQDDDVALIWLEDQSKTQMVADYLNLNAKALFIDEVISGNDLKLKFNDPLKDAATPDIIVQPLAGTIYTGKAYKIAEHGGFSANDTNVGLIVANPKISKRSVKSPVATSQVAATILESLNISPDKLKAVRKEGTQVLPFLFNK